MVSFSRFTWGRRGLAPDPDALYATFELRNAQSLGRDFVAGKFLGQKSSDRSRACTRNWCV